VRHDARQNRERILVAAEQVFGARGAAGSTEDVATLAQVGIGTVFRHFPTKDALVEATLLRHFADLTARACSLAEADDPGAALRELLTVMIATGAAKVRLVTLMGATGSVPATVVEAAQDLREAVGAVLRRAQGAGVARAAVGVDEVYVLLRGLAHASATMPVAEDVLRRAADVVLTGLMPRQATLGR
jgi:AcrR family transcriptional regulator